MWWMIAQAAAGVVQKDQEAAAQVYGDVTAFLAAQDATMRAWSDAQATAGALARDKAMTSVGINKKQREAQASAELNAAFSGVTGNTVQNVIYNTKANAAYAQSAATMTMDMQMEQSYEDVYSAAYTYHSTRYEPPQSKLGKMLKGAWKVASDAFITQQGWGFEFDGQAYADSLSM